MNLVTIAWKSVRQRALASGLTALSVALGVTLMVSVLVINSVVDRLFTQSSTGYHLVVGAKGSPLQLVLNTIYQLGVPVENIPYNYYKTIRDDPRVAHAIPFASGDATQEGAFRIVGTIPEYFEIPYIPGENYRVKGHFLRGDFDAVIGSQVARTNGWTIGDEFSPVHGGNDDHVHEEKFRIVGVLAPTGTPSDKVVFIHLDGFYQIAGHEKPLDEALKREQEFQEFEGKNTPTKKSETRTTEAAEGDTASVEESIAAEGETAEEHEGDAHDEHGHDEHGHDEHGHEGHHHHELPDEQKEVTSILVLTKHPIMSIQMRAQINEGPYAQAANPVQQINWLLDNVVGNIRIMLVVLTGLIIVVSGVGIFVSIYNSMADRRREIAVMRALGARRVTVFSIVLAESILLCVGGGLMGLLLGHGLVFVAAPIVEARSGILLNPYAFEPLELILFPVLLSLAALVGVIPGLTAYRTDVARTLAS